MSEENKKAVAADERVYTLRRPFTFDGEKVKTLFLDFDKLTGGDFLSAERRFYQDGGVGPADSARN
ncbi:hypothetical protein SAMN02799624_00943 [Paenibacillus sp. UNC496MF]|uniref:hypothetical protein n=1 Tax=Paenibacillus sp. UNC496MF TaxID=1502753 RepID=UPI0008E5DD53|nr:hypothetical protein [Paenibacillus sp. UNC496MF]SFI42236.1 hypothetical protein SAMN02799624_00943 [Paenibacillus sp. UNC496MF]